ncbi:MAG: inositol monophosphatase family protein [Anaerolineae bacterium]
MTEIQAAVAAAREAGALLRDAFGRSHTVALKRTAIDLVTEMDQAAEALIIERLQAAFPDYGFLTEESPALTGADNARWVIDPIDGTTNYAHGYPLFAVSIALERAGQLVLGVVYNPIADELFTAKKGHGAFLNGCPIHVSEATTLQESLLATGFPYDVWDSEDDNTTEWRQFLKRARSLRCDGSAALDLCFVACGRLDGYWEHGLEPWDMAAGALIVSEAGAQVTDYRGGEDFIASRQVVAANPHLHAEMLAVLQMCALINLNQPLSY